MLGIIIYLLSPNIRANVADNVRHVLRPEVDQPTLKRTVRGVLVNLSKNYFDLIKIPRLKFDDIKRSITIHSPHYLLDALNRGKGVILVTAHLGSFDMTAQWLAIRSIKTIILVEALEPLRLFQHVTELRESQGLTLVPVRPGVGRVAMQRLRRGEVVVVACDRDIQEDGLKFKFFGEEASLPVGAIRLAMRTEATIVPAFNLRRADGHYDIFIEQPVEIPSSGKDRLVKGMEQVVAIMEKYIRKSPEQWVVLSRIWGDRRHGKAPE